MNEELIKIVTEDNFDVETAEVVESEVHLEDFEQSVDVEETVETVEVETVEEIEIEVEEAVGWVGGNSTRHYNLSGRDEVDQHPITAITGLRAELNQIEALQTVCSDKKQQADYYLWGETEDIGPGYFVRLGKDGKIYKCTNETIDGEQVIKTYRTIDILGVTVSEAGFVGNDNNGLEGIEMVYDDQLKGVPGRIVSANKTAGLEIPDNYESYYEPQNGKSVVLTIDETIQHFAEKHLETARIENQLEEGAAAIVMNVKTGEILAMATKPDYDLNQPFAITEAVEQKYPEIKTELEKLEGSEYNAKLTEVTQFLRRNKAVVDSYEPGSTFKIAVASMALEENVVGLNDHFFCGGSIKVADRRIACANRNGHGAETFVQGVQNSCNPVFIEVGARVGREKFMKYVKGFGFRETTGIELPGETDGIFHAAENFKEIDLATSSFGQSFNVTPLQMITMVAAVANGGTLMKPHLVKQLVDEDKNVIEEYKPTVVRQVISKETSDTMCKILESVVSEGGGKNAYLAGYRIAGKTGTSEKQPRGNGKYVASFVGFAPADDPEIVCLVILDQPPVGNTYYGGLIAAPVVKNILEESLQYLGVEPEYTQEELELIEITVPDITGKTRKEAEAMLKEVGVNISIKGQGDIVFDQVPKPNSKLAKNSKVVAYTEGEESRKTVTIPNVVGCYGSEANKGIINAGLNVRIKGLSNTGGIAICTEQSPAAGTVVEPGTIVTLDFRFAEIRD